MSTTDSDRRIRTAATMLGIGLGGFIDGILLHQILQLHNLLSARIPKTSVANLEINMFWDGIFHLVTWVVTVSGVYLLWVALRTNDAPPPTRWLTGMMLFGWGLFNLVEGVVDHLVLGIHHVVESAENHLPADLAFVASGVLLMLLGLGLARTDYASPSRDQSNS